MEFLKPTEIILVTVNGNSWTFSKTLQYTRLATFRTNIVSVRSSVYSARSISVKHILGISSILTGVVYYTVELVEALAPHNKQILGPRCGVWG